jgi:hypothetical protein
MNKSLKYLNQTPVTSKPESQQQSLSSSSASITSNGPISVMKQQQQQHNQSTNNNNNNKFYQTFKTLFDIFDPDLRGYIDLNELELLGANQNEILNDIINYLKNSQNITNFVTFNTFVNTADVVLKKRKLAKTQLKQNYKKTLSEEFDQQKLQQNIHQLQQQQQQHQQQQPIPQPQLNHRLQQQQQLQNEQIIQPKEPFILQNANSFDLSILLEQENCLLNDGLIELNKIKLFYEQKLNENRLKKLNILKLKHQNLFSIDKMLLNLNEINNLNKFLNTFNQNNNWMDTNDNNSSFDDDLNMLLKAAQLTQSLTTTTTTPPQQNNNNDENIYFYDKFIKEKQERIENLQKEKSNLIRKLFEVKSKINENFVVKNVEIKTKENMDETKHEDYLFQ